jgi:hypothetical protein
MNTAVLTLVLQGALCTAPAEYPFAGLNPGAPVWGGSILFNSSTAAEIAATGCRTVRINFRLDGHASWDATILAQYDTIIQNALNNNIEVLGLLSNECRPEGQVQWNDDPDGDGINPFVIAYSQTAYDLINRYKTQITRWEIWNEPDAWTNPDWQTDPQHAGGPYLLPRVYAHILAETYLQCNWYSGRTLLDDYGIELSTAGVFAHDIGGSNPNWYNAYTYMVSVFSNGVWDWMEANTGRRYPWDFFGYHFYLSQGTGFDSTQLTQYLNRMRSLKSSNNDPSPFLMTEFGWQYVIGEQLQADSLRDAYNYLKAQSDVARGYWYQWSDDVTGAWGLRNGDGSPRLSYYEFVAQQTVSPPVAAFVGSPTTGEAPLPVQFTDQSTGSIDTWSWDFGDTGTSDQADPSHTYTEPGQYTVSLTVTGPGGSDTETKSLYIDVTSPLAPADFDEDGDVDLTDYGTFLACYEGPGVPYSIPACSVADFDTDTDVDLSDYGVFLSCYNGPNQPPACP